MDELAKLKNLGPQSAKWLQRAGIHTRADLEAAGPLKAYARVRQVGLPASLNLVYAIQATLMDLHWQKLPLDVRDELKVAVRLMADGGEPPPWGDTGI